MAVVGSDLKLRYSGGAANADGDASLGGVPSAVNLSIADNSLHNLFDLVTGPQGEVGDTSFRILYVVNSSASEALDVRVHFENNYDDDLSMGIREAKEVNAQVLATEIVVPTAVVWTAPATRDAGLVIGGLAAGEKRALYLRRIVTAGANAKDRALATVRVSAESGE